MPDQPSRSTSSPQDDAPRVVRRPRRKAGWSTGKRVAVGAAAVLATLALIAGAGAVWGLWSFASIDRVDLDLAQTAPTEPQNFLVVGSDSRADITEDDPGAGGMIGEDAPTGQRADSLMIARIDPDSDRIDLLSVPRDLWVPIAGTDKEQRINTAYSQSAQAVVDTVQNALGIPINHFVEVDFQGFSSLVDSLGGVPMYFSDPVRDKNSGLYVDTAGCRVLDGTEGLAFARARHLEYRSDGEWVSDPTGDLGRMTRQQLLTRAALAKAQTLGVGDVGKLRGLVNAGLDSVSLDSTLGTGDLIDLGGRISDLDPDRMQTHSLPVVAHTTDAGAAVVLLDEPAAQPVLDIFRGVTTAAPVTTTTAPPPSMDEVTVHVYNGTDIDGEARRVSFVLTSDGDFVAGAVDTTTKPVKHTYIAYPKDSRAMAELVARWLSPEVELKEDPKLPPAAVALVLGQDFERVAEPDPLPATTTTTTAAPAAGATAATVPSTTTTTQPGWTPGQPPQGVTCT
jgi:LCP family protein required for cell wall assembly